MHIQCKKYTPEKDNPYPLCINDACAVYKTCNISAGMDESRFDSRGTR